MKDFDFCFYSALVQSSATMLGILGVFIVFRIQYIRERLKSTIRQAAEIIREVEKNKEASYLMSQEEITKRFKELIKSVEKVIVDPQAEGLRYKAEKYQEYITLFEYYKDSEAKLVNEAKDAFLAIGVLFIFCLLRLYLIPFLSFYPEWSLKIFSIVTGILIVVTIIAVWKFIYSALNFKEKSK